MPPSITKAQSRERLVSIQSKLAVALIAEGDQSALWEIGLDAVLELDSIDCGSVHLFDHEHGATTIIATRNLPPKLTAHLEPHDFDAGQANVGHVRQPVYQSWSSLPASAQADLKSVGVKCLMALPVIYQNEVLAIINLASFSQEQTATWTRLFLEGVTAQLAAAIVRIRSFNTSAEHDIELEKKVRELSLGENNFQTIFEVSPVIMALTDVETGVYVDVNATFLKQLGYTRKEVVGTRAIDLGIFFEPSTRDQLMQIFTEQGFILNHEVRIRHKLGSSFHGLFSSYLVDLTDKPVMLTTCIDISERKKLEKQLRHSQRMEVVGQLTGGVAHDFNNLLGIMLGNAELLEQIAGDGMLARKFIESIKAAVYRGSSLTNRLLAFSRKANLAPVSADVSELIIGLNDMLERALGETIELKVEKIADLWPAMIDTHQFENVLVNLALNARDAMPQGGILTIETSNVSLDETYAEQHEEVEAGDYVAVAVSDTGTGIPADIQGRVFEPFFTTKDVGKGSGLGLSMVFGFVKQSSGHITLYSEDGLGTSVKLYMPRSLNRPAKTDDREEISGRAQGSERILVVEDDPELREIPVIILRDLGYEVVEAEDGEKAIAALNAGPRFDLLFTDVVLPGGMNGMEIAKEAMRIQPDIKILYTSGYAENAVIHHGKLDPGVNLVSKPYRRAELIKRVREMLGDEAGGNLPSSS